MIRNLRFLAFLTLILLALPSYSQLTVTSGVPTSTLINSLVGNGATVSNVTINCPSIGYGTFTATSTNLGLTSGVLLTTGDVNVAVGPNNSASAGSDNGSSANDPNLTSIEPAAADQNVCILEFDIVPSCNRLNIDYVFGSEEYPEFVNSSYNDVFGFFITGPNPSGGNYNGQNIALIPSTSTPVAINSVNQNTGYYVDNTGGSTIQYDGFTTPLVAYANVVPCSTYHMKIAIADAGDNIYDSGVFFAYQGLNCPTAPTVTMNTANTTVCPGQTTTLSASGATSYVWSPATGLNTTTGSSVVATPSSTTTYTVTGSAGCSITTATVVVTVSSPTVSAGADVTICQGGSTTLGASGATTYTWSPSTGLSSTTIFNPVASPSVTTTYTVTGSSGASCVSTDQVIVNVNSITVNAPSNTTVCPGGSTTLTANGATTYTWSPATGLSTTSGATTTASPAATTTYTVTGTTNGCTDTDIVIVGVGVMTVTASSDTSICSGGTAQLSASGGTTFSWSPATGLSNPNIQNPTASPAATTTYVVTGTSGSCTDTDTVIVTVGSITVTASMDVTVCAGTSTLLSATGATTYSWTPAASLSNATISNPLATPSATTTYTVTGTSGGCTDTDDVVVTVNPIPTVTATPVSSICAGSSANLNASGAMTYSWSPSTGLSASNISNPVASPAGTTTYTVTGTTDNCTDTATVVVTVNPIPVINAGNDTAICPGASAQLTATGATAYTWSPVTGLNSSTIANPVATPASTTTYTVTGTALGCTATDEVVVTILPGTVVSAGPDVAICEGTSTTLQASGASTYSWSPAATLSDPAIANPVAAPLSTTTYTVTGTNSGCIGTDEVIVVVNQIPVITAGPSAAVCQGTVSGILASGGTTYTWNPVAGLSDPFIANPFATPAATTTYTVTGISNGCTDTAQVIITVNPIPVINAGLDTSVCTGGSATLNASGATSYTWSPATGLSATNIPNPVSTPGATTTYTVTGTMNGCTSTDEVVVAVIPPVVPDAGNDTIICYGTSAQLHASGATTYTWSPAATLSDASVYNPVANPLTTTTYTVTGTMSGCVGTDMMIVNVPAQLSITPAAYDATCFNACNGQAIAVPSGGTSPYTFSWSTTPSAQTPAISNVCAGTYTVSISDFFGCSADTTVVVGQPTEIIPSVTSVAAHCGHPDGSATASATGGSPGYSYTWNTSPQQVAPTAINLVPGTYSYTVTDNNNCSVSDTVIVGDTPGVIASINNTTTPPTNTTCYGVCNGTASALATGGTTPYNYTWQTTPVQITANATGLCAGTYSVIVSDGTSCLDTATVIITQPDPVTVIGSSADTICIGQSTTIGVTASGGTPGYSYTWWPAADLSSTTVQNPTASPAATATYSVSANDNNNCPSDTSSVIITVNPPLDVTASSDAAICINSQTTISVAASAGGNGGPYTYSWEPSSGLSTTTGSSVDANPVTTTTYTVVISDNCTVASDTDYVAVTVNPLPVISFTTPDNDGCYPHTTSFSNTTSGAVSCAWDFGDGNTSGVCDPSHTFTTEGSYNVALTVTDVNGCVNTLTENSYITVYGYPEADFTMGPQPTTILNPNIEFTDMSLGSPVSWQWYFEDLDSSSVQNPTYTFQDTGTFDVKLIIMNQYGCPDDTTISVRIDPDFVIFFPNAFTPNGDGLNEKFYPVGYGWEESSFEMMIFDRWGNLIYSTKDYKQGWDGKANNGSGIAQEDVYIWKVKVAPIMDKTRTKEFRGQVSIVK